MDKTELKERIYAKIDELPTIPVVVTRLLGLLENPNVQVKELTGVISSDPALASKVLKVANSAYYGFSQEISTLDRAVALLGLNMVKSLALSIGILRNLPKTKDTEHFTTQGLWLHSLAVATAAKELGYMLGRPREDDYLFVVGLLHDVGKIVLLHFFMDRYLEALEEIRVHENTGLFVAERQAMGFDHGEVGALVLKRWKFPMQVVQPIAVHHHQKMPAKINLKDVACLRIADTIPQELGLGQEGNPTPPGILSEDLDILGLSEPDLDHLRRSLLEDREKLENFFTAMSMG